MDAHELVYLYIFISLCNRQIEFMDGLEQSAYPWASAGERWRERRRSEMTCWFGRVVGTGCYGAGE